MSNRVTRISGWSVVVALLVLASAFVVPGEARSPLIRGHISTAPFKHMPVITSHGTHRTAGPGIDSVQLMTPNAVRAWFDLSGAPGGWDLYVCAYPHGTTTGNCSGGGLVSSQFASLLTVYTDYDVVAFYRNGAVDSDTTWMEHAAYTDTGYGTLDECEGYFYGPKAYNDVYLSWSFPFAGNFTDFELFSGFSGDTTYATSEFSSVYNPTTRGWTSFILSYRVESSFPQYFWVKSHSAYGDGPMLQIGGTPITVADASPFFCTDPEENRHIWLPTPLELFR